MNPAALLDEFADAGVILSLNGDRLHYQTRPGVGIAPNADRIRNAKPALLALLHVQDEIVPAATVATAAFDRQHYDDLWRRWHELNQETH